MIPRRRASIGFSSDSRRWDSFVARPDDIFISTPPKCGTTWTQTIVASLLWPDGDGPGAPMDISPWFDARLGSLDDMIARVSSIPHRRFVKTHSPADGIVIFPECRYLVVYRDPADALVSWANHRASLSPEVTAAMNADAAADGFAPRPVVWDGDISQLLDEVEQDGTIFEHLASWWPKRHEPYVLFVHYADLTADLSGEMRRIAGFLDIAVPEREWADVVARCDFASTRKAHEGSRMSRGFAGGAAGFFHQGGTGRGQAELPLDVLARLDRLRIEQLPDKRAAAWLDAGSLELGWRPDAHD